MPHFSLPLFLTFWLTSSSQIVLYSAYAVEEFGLWFTHEDSFSSVFLSFWKKRRYEQKIFCSSSLWERFWKRRLWWNSAISYSMTKLFPSGGDSCDIFFLSFSSVWKRVARHISNWGSFVLIFLLTRQPHFLERTIKWLLIAMNTLVSLDK